jgi:hypothetical protein
VSLTLDSARVGRICRKLVSVFSTNCITHPAKSCTQTTADIRHGQSSSAYRVLSRSERRSKQLFDGIVFSNDAKPLMPYSVILTISRLPRGGIIVAAVFVICGSVLGAAAVILFYLFLDYPAKETNWTDLLFHVYLLLGVAATLVLAGGGMALGKEPPGVKRKRIAVLLVAIIALASFRILGNTTTANNVISPNARPPDRYEFTSDWVTGNVPHWKQALAQVKGKPNIRAL